MSKKIIGMFSCLLIAMVSYAQEDMKFVTMLSQPVGVFKQVDLTADSANVNEYNQMDKLIFCNKKSSDEKGCEIVANSVQVKDSVNVPGVTLDNSLAKGTLQLGEKSKLAADSSVKHFYVKKIELKGLDLPSTSEDAASSLIAKKLNAENLTGWNSNSKVKILIGNEELPIPFIYTKEVESGIATALNRMCIGPNGTDDGFGSEFSCSKVKFESNDITGANLKWGDDKILNNPTTGAPETKGTKFLTN